MQQKQTKMSNQVFPQDPLMGGFPKKKDWPAQYPSIVIAVENIINSISKIAEAGGEVLGEPMEIQGVCQYVSFIDTEGNQCSILQPTMDS